MTALVSVENLCVEYSAVGQVNHAVNDASFEAAPGEVVGIVGESGSGKSTATLAILGLTRPGGRIVSGRVVFEGRDLLGLSDREWRTIRGVRIALVTQNPRGALNPVARVGDQLVTAYRAHHDVGKDQARVRALELLRIVGINDPERRLRAYPHELSGGMAQRVVIAMALSCNPMLLIADEPTSGLDVTVQAQVLDDLRGAVREVGSALLLVTQDLGIVANYCDRVYVIHAGEVVEESPTDLLFEHPSHPSSAALLVAQRGLRDEAFKLRGFPVDGRRLPDGCFLHPRCPFADEGKGCMTEHPSLRQVGERHMSRCHRVETVVATVEARLRARALAETGGLRETDVDA